MTIGWAKALTILLILFKPVSSLANDIYVQQVGDLFDGTISQDGQNNHPSSINP